MYRFELTINREAFNDIYLNFSKKNGVTRFAESGFGWKPASGGDGTNFTLDASQIVSAQWSRAARGWEIKVLSKDRKDSVIQLDGFKQDVRWRKASHAMSLTGVGLRSYRKTIQALVQRQPREQGACAPRLELGQSRIRQGRALLQRRQPSCVRGAVHRNLKHKSSGQKRSSG